MKAEGLRGVSREKTRKTTIGEGAQTDRPPERVQRRFVATAPNQLWVADLTSVGTHVGWTYVAFVLDEIGSAHPTAPAARPPARMRESTITGHQTKPLAGTVPHDSRPTFSNASRP